MLFVLTVLIAYCSLSLAAPGPCPKVTPRPMKDPAKLMGFWYQPWQTQMPNDKPYMCATTTFSNWDPTKGTFDALAMEYTANNTKVPWSGSFTRKTSYNCTWSIVSGADSIDGYILDYTENNHMFLYSCMEENGGKNHTEIAYVFTRDLSNYWSHWWRVFVTAVANKLYYLNLMSITYDDCPK